MDRMKKAALHATAASPNSGAETVVVSAARCAATANSIATIGATKPTATRHAAKANSSAPIPNFASKRIGVATATWTAPTDLTSFTATRPALRTTLPAPTANALRFCGAAMATTTAAMDQMRPKRCALTSDARLASSAATISSASLRRKSATITRTAKTDPTKNRLYVRPKDCVYLTNSGAVAAIASTAQWPVTASTTAATTATKSIAALNPFAVSASALNCASRRRMAPTVAIAPLATLQCPLEPASRKPVLPMETPVSC